MCVDETAGIYGNVGTHAHCLLSGSVHLQYRYRRYAAPKDRQDKTGRACVSIICQHNYARKPREWNEPTSPARPHTRHGTKSQIGEQPTLCVQSLLCQRKTQRSCFGFPERLARVRATTDKVRGKKRIHRPWVHSHAGYRYEYTAVAAYMYGTLCALAVDDTEVARSAQPTLVCSPLPLSLVQTTTPQGEETVVRLSPTMLPTGPTVVVNVGGS